MELFSHKYAFHLSRDNILEGVVLIEYSLCHGQDISQHSRETASFTQEYDEG